MCRFDWNEPTGTFFSTIDQKRYGLVLEHGLTRIEDRADAILADPRIAQLFLGGGIAA
jgi:branched-chain amino acid transport system ATP-binding protein